jgi:hypothetical protein
MAQPTIRLACAAERAALEELQQRAALALPDYRAQLEAHPDAIDLPAARIAEGGCWWRRMRRRSPASRSGWTARGG